MNIKTVIRASVYYIFLIIFTYIYNLVTETFLIFDFLYEKIDVMEKNTFKNNVKYCYAHAILLVLKLVGVTIHLDKEISSNRMIWISNHRSKLDGLIIQSLLYLNGCNNVAVVKKSISYIPIFGSYGENVDSVFIDRNSDTAKEILTKASIKCSQLNTSILIFPEGATLSPSSKIRSDRFALDNNINKLDSVLIPKTAGFDIIKANGQFTEIGELTIRYDNPSLPGFTEHSFLDLFEIFPTEVYFNVNHHETDDFDLRQVFETKNIILNEPLNKNNYSAKVKYSKLLVLANVILFVGFNYFNWINVYFRYASIALSVFSIIRMLISNFCY